MGYGEPCNPAEACHRRRAEGRRCPPRHRGAHSTACVWIIPTASLVLIGTVIGDMVRSQNTGHRSRILALVIAGLLLTSGGLLWQQHLLMSKALWTPPYILFTTGFGTFVLLLLYLLIDLRPSRVRWSYPLLVFGSNAILAYVVPILAKVWILERWHITTGATIEQWILSTLGAHVGVVAAGWCYTISYILICWGILLLLYRKRWFLRV